MAVFIAYEQSFPNPVFSFHSLMLYYFRSMTKSHLHMIDMLKDQLVLVRFRSIFKSLYFMTGFHLMTSQCHFLSYNVTTLQDTECIIPV